LLFFLSVDELLLLLLAGCGVMLVKKLWRTKWNIRGNVLPISGVLAHVGSSPAVEAPATWLNVFLFFLKIGSVLYGSGYVLLLAGELVERNQWLTPATSGCSCHWSVHAWSCVYHSDLHWLSARAMLGRLQERLASSCPLLFWWA